MYTVAGSPNGSRGRLRYGSCGGLNKGFHGRRGRVTVTPATRSCSAAVAAQVITRRSRIVRRRRRRRFVNCQLLLRRSRLTWNFYIHRNTIHIAPGLQNIVMIISCCLWHFENPKKRTSQTSKTNNNLSRSQNCSRIIVHYSLNSKKYKHINRI